MEIDIWVISNKKREMLEAQHRINASGSMRAVCILNKDALEQLLYVRNKIPSLIIVDYEMSKEEDFALWSWLKLQQGLTGIPMFFMTAGRDSSIRDECYRLGTLGVLEKPFSQVAIERIEQMAWQFHVARNTEKKLEKQAMDLKVAREIERLNKQLKARNELLYQVFGRYFSDEVVERIFEDPSSVSIGGEKKDLTIMLSDLRGFTAISQQMDSDAMLDLLNFYFGKMVEIIRKYKGTVIEFLGDGILAVFGAPIFLKEPTESAVKAAIEMQNCMEEVNQYCTEKGYRHLSMGIGIHRGEAFIGNIGSDTVMRYNVHGRVVNECSRIESYCVGGQVLISEEALNGIGGEYTIRKTMEVRAKGVEKTLKVHDITKIHEVMLEEKEDAEPLVLHVDGKIFIEMYPVDDKMIRESFIRAEVKDITRKGFFVESTDELNLYSDVKLLGRNENGELIFKDAYAKVVEKRSNLVKLHFTFVSDSLQNTLKEMRV